jgi:hypothetical protein
LDGRLASRNADPLNPVVEGHETLQYGLKGNRFNGVWLQNQLVIVTIWTSQVTIGQEENRTYLAWPVQQRGFNEALDGGKLVSGH